MIGYVNTDFCMFCFGDEEFVDAQVEAICDSLYMEARLRMQGIDLRGNEGDKWDF